ncbi:LysM peptidoglycan-binding domain-containing protein [Algoriphagus lutimaris]|uniref:LysM peptidoglycan-binding domain-containing protein n=1 Tax=Algoriphagus lutimaris TaxID=613197 RepID=UPI00196B8926|nr:LysM peptidoglycan-binding domain-containing protein [Algoriphagus lutimaris]MBN3519620.1 LysM peptidoglycan-binding domain-containing protein [Algoriphagus lutimaris]
MIFGSKFHLAIFSGFLLISSTSIASEMTSIDSVGVERVGDKTYILHAVEPKETLFGISRRYAAPVSEIIESNAVLKQGLKIGQTIRVPFIAKSEIPDGASIHKVVPGETLFSISKKYGVTVSEVMQWNELKGNDLSVGQGLIIKKPIAAAQPKAEPVVQESPKTEVAVVTTSVPVKKEEVEKPEVVEKKTEKPAPAPEKNEEKEVVENKAADNAVPIAPGEWVSHEVKSGETLFSIANQYQARVEDLITWNALTSNNVRVGQTLKVGRGEVGPSTVPIVGTPRVVTDADEMNIPANPDNASGGFKNIKETGQAELIEGTGGHKKYLVLHRTAPVGTIMRIKNEENDVTIFARVVGTLPETGDNSKLVIKLSQAAYDQLKAVNPRFPVEVMY